MILNKAENVIVMYIFLYKSIFNLRSKRSYNIRHIVRLSHCSKLKCSHRSPDYRNNERNFPYPEI